MDHYEFLSWDSEVFQFPVARIAKPDLNIQSLKSLLIKLNNQNVRLVYWPTDPLNEKYCQSALELGGLLVGINRTYCCELSSTIKLKSDTQLQLSPVSPKYRNNLIELILRRGISSRFYKDDRIREKYYVPIMTKWIVDSIKNNIGFVNAKSKQLLGYISLSKKDGFGNIDYIIVDDKLADQGLGSKLLEYGHLWFKNNKYLSVIAVTQKENIPACRLYEKYGYTIMKEEAYYHFWL